jgi:hypothetical protein
MSRARSERAPAPGPALAAADDVSDEPLPVDPLVSLPVLAELVGKEIEVRV